MTNWIRYIYELIEWMGVYRAWYAKEGQTRDGNPPPPPPELPPKRPE